MVNINAPINTMPSTAVGTDHLFRGNSENFEDDNTEARYR